MRALLLGFAFLALVSATPVRAQLLADISDSQVSLNEAETTVAGKRTIAKVVSRPVFSSFTGMAIEIFSDAEALEGRVRIDENGSWGEWIPLHIVRSATSGFHIGGFHGDQVWSSTRFHVEIWDETGESIRFGSAGVFDNRLDDDLSPVQVEQEPRQPRVQAQDHITPPPLITRSEWSASPFVLGNPVPLANPTYDYMTFHHAAGYSATTYEEGLAQVKAIQELHQFIRGWSDIGYQFLIDRSGRVYQGRPFMDSSTSLSQLPVLARGAHVGGFNTGNIGICMLGCYHPPEGGFCEEAPTVESLASYANLFAFLSAEYGAPADNIRGHRDWSPTACPGDNNYSLLPSVISSVQYLILTGNQPVATGEIFASIDEGGTVRVNWQFLEDFGIDSYRIERTFNGEVVVLAAGSGNASSTVADPGIIEAGIASYALYAGADDGRQQRVATVEIDLDLPDLFILSEAFPNPASSQTSVRYFLAHDGFVNVALYDATGREVQRIEDRFRKGDQWALSTVNTSTLPSGMYFYRIQVNGYAGIVFDETRAVAVIN